MKRESKWYSRKHLSITKEDNSGEIQEINKTYRKHIANDRSPYQELCVNRLNSPIKMWRWADKL